MKKLNYYLVEAPGGHHRFHAPILDEVERGDLIVSAEKDACGFTMRWRKAGPGERSDLRVVKFTGFVEE